MSATQLILIALVLLAFAIGWIARGMRAAQGDAELRAVTELDSALGTALTSFQAALALWQAEAELSATRGARAVATFEAQRSAAEELAAATSLPAAGQEAFTRIEQAFEHLSDGLGAGIRGQTLDGELTRALLRAERMMMAARGALLLAARRG